MSSMKTPGVYVVEKSAFPNSVVEVATAVPAFIGYTEKALNGTKLLRSTPWRISSMAEFVQYFGEKPLVKFDVKVSEDKDSFISLNAPEYLSTVKLTAPGVKLIVDIAVAAEDKDGQPAADASDKDKADAKLKAKETLDKALAAVREYNNSALNLAQILMQGVPKDAAAAATATTDINAIKAKAAEITALTDPKEDSDPATAIVPTKASDLKTAYDALAALVNAYGAGNANLKYYSVARTDKFSLYHNMRLFFANGGGPCYIVSVGNYNEEFSAEKLEAGIETLLREQEPTMIVIPEAVNIDRDKNAGCFNIQQAMLKHCQLTMSRVAILDIYDGDKDRRDPDAGDVIKNFRENIGTEGLDYAAAYYPFLNTSVVSDSEIDFANINKEGLNAFKAVLLSDTPQLEKYIAYIGSATATREELAIAHKVLYKQSRLYADIMKEMLHQVNLLPPSAAMAGIYTITDHNKEVWKAPANVGLANVISTAVNITYADQEDMNVPLDGKAVNAIRYFTGEGIKVWGARTLDGNSLDWRYINVRRTMIMLEESIRNAAKAFVFDPNVANTWVIVRSTISNFLTGIWKRGGLPGATPEDAFSVHVGLGDTMTPDEILEGIMRITVLVAISRPAEFIEITFMQQMQKS